MKFVFAFEKILHHRRGVEDLVRRDWLVAQGHLQILQRQLERFFSEVEQARLRTGQIETSGSARGPQLALTDEFIRGQQFRIDRKRVEIREQMTEVERRHEILIEAAKEKKILEKLRERRLAEYRQLRKKMELKSVDELIVTRAGRKADYGTRFDGGFRGVSEDLTVLGESIAKKEEETR